jgi:hypothetical protein
MRTYCTQFDSLYLAQGIVMLRSLRRFDPAASIHVLALDPSCERVLRDVFQSSISVTAIGELHSQKPELATLQESRSAWAWYATHKPAFVRFVLESMPLDTSVTFVDADMRFFADPSSAYDELAAASIGLSPHRFPSSAQGLAIYGAYNAGWIYWRAGTVARQCLADWESQCIAWCAPEVQPGGRFMNQGYLTAWPNRYPRVHVLNHPGVNLAPWNIDGHLLKRGWNKISVDGRPLICFHFSGLLRDASGCWYSIYPPPRQFDLARKSIYEPYLDEVESESRRLSKTHGLTGIGSVRSLSVAPGHTRIRR